MVKQSTQYTIAAVVLVGVFIGAFMAKEYLLPETLEEFDDDKPEGNYTVFRTGQWTGKDGKATSGTLILLKQNSTYVLRFEDFEMTAGPDVFLYLTPSPDPDTQEEVLAGTKVLITGGADGGELTKKGNFNQELPADFDPVTFQGAAAWCDQFDRPFGAAALLPP